MGPMTEPSTQEADVLPAPSVADLIELHSAYGKEIEVNDADGRIYAQDTCRCGMPLGMHLSLEDHRAQEIEAYIRKQLTESFLTVRNQLMGVVDELELHDAPMHIQATMDQIIVENSLRLGLYDPEVEGRAETLRTAVRAWGLPYGVSFFNQDGSANFIWQQPNRRFTVYIVHGEPFEVEVVPDGPLTPFRSGDVQETVLEVKKLLAAGEGS